MWVQWDGWHRVLCFSFPSMHLLDNGALLQQLGTLPGLITPSSPL
jgi:hypothetical protein